MKQPRIPRQIASQKAQEIAALHRLGDIGNRLADAIENLTAMLDSLRRERESAEQ